MRATTAVTIDDLTNISFAMDELKGALSDAVKDSTDERVKEKVTEVTEFIYNDVMNRLGKYNI